MRRSDKVKSQISAELLNFTLRLAMLSKTVENQRMYTKSVQFKRGHELSRIRGTLVNLSNLPNAF